MCSRWCIRSRSRDQVQYRRCNQWCRRCRSWWWSRGISRCRRFWYRCLALSNSSHHIHRTPYHQLSHTSSLPPPYTWHCTHHCHWYSRRHKSPGHLFNHHHRVHNRFNHQMSTLLLRYRPDMIQHLQQYTECRQCDRSRICLCCCHRRSRQGMC